MEKQRLVDFTPPVKSKRVDVNVEPEGLASHADLLDPLVGKSLLRIDEILSIDVAPKHKDFLKIKQLQLQAADHTLKLQARVDENRLRKRTSDGLQRLLDAIKAKEGDPKMIDVTPSPAS